MSNTDREKLLGESPIPALLSRLSVPALVAMMVNALYNIVDTIFVGRGVGAVGIGGLTIAFPVQILIMSFAMLVGTGAASIISRALGARDYEKANQTAGVAFTMIAAVSVVLAILIWALMDPLLFILGATGNLMAPARSYLSIILLGTPFISGAMAGNNIIRAEGQAKVAMMVMLAGTVLNLILDPIFIFALGLGIQGAAMATVLAQAASFLYMVFYFRSGRSSLKFGPGSFRPRGRILKEITALGMPAFVRQLAGSLLMVLVNNSIRFYGSEMAIAAFGVVHRLLLFAMMPMFGVAQGFQPIAGYNFGAGWPDRVLEVFKLATLATTILGAFFFLAAMTLAPYMVRIFGDNPDLIAVGSRALRLVAAAAPLIGFQVIGATYFMAVGKAFPSLILSLSRQVLFLIPIVIILPRFFGLDGVWGSFPAADILSTLVTAVWISFELRNLRREIIAAAET